MVYTVEDPVYDRSQPRPDIQLLYSYPLKNVPGFTIIGLKVSFPPGGGSPPHRHGGASVAGVVLSGTGYNKMNDSPTMVLTKGETWYEAPGCHHKISANFSDTEDFVIIATMVIGTKVFEEGGMDVLVQIDEEYR